MAMGEKMNALRTKKRKSLNITDTHIMNLLALLKLFPIARVSISSIVSQCLYAKSELLAFLTDGGKGRGTFPPLHPLNAFGQSGMIFRKGSHFPMVGSISDLISIPQSLSRYSFSALGGLYFIKNASQGSFFRCDKRS